MKIPDLISPIIGHRVWRWDAAGLTSLNGKPWSPRQPLAAKCGAGNAHDAHEPPHLDRTCGVYAAKNIEHLRPLGYEGRGIRGEVHLWGTVVEHELGWRAQFAYPKSLVLPPDLISSDTKEMEARLGALAAYDIDIFMLGGGRKIPVCRRGLGFDAAGLDYLIGKRTQYYVRRQRDRTLMKGDRVAVLRPRDRGWSSRQTTRRCTRCRRRCQDRTGLDPLSARVFPAIPQPREREQLPGIDFKAVRLLRFATIPGEVPSGSAG